jgi:hypothetical protein
LRSYDINEFEACLLHIVQTGVNDKHGRADYDLGGARALFAEMYQIIHAKGMIQIQDNSVPALTAFNYYTDILLTGEIHYMLLQYHNLTHVAGESLHKRIEPTMAQSWWAAAQANVPVVFDTKPPTKVM